MFKKSGFWLILLFLLSIALLIFGLMQSGKELHEVDLLAWVGGIGSLASMLSLLWILIEKKHTPSVLSNESILKKRYYKALAANASRLDLSIISDPFAEKEAQISLPKIYQDQRVRVEKQKEEYQKDEVSKQTENESIPLLEAIAEDKYNRLVILGKVGSGKSSFVDYLSWGIASSWQGEKTENIHSSLCKRPIARITLRNIAVKLDTNTSQQADSLILEAIKSSIRNLISEDMPHYYDELMEQGIILLDGLDEVTRNDGRLFTILDAIDSFAERMSAHAKLIITSRPYAYDSHRLKNFKVVELEPMDNEQIEAFIQHWYQIMPAKDVWRHGAKGQANDLSAMVLDPRRRYLKELAETPLTLTLMTSLHYARNILPHSRAELYESSLNLLLDRWQTRLQDYKNQHGVFEEDEYKALNLEHDKLSDLLAGLAIKVHIRQQKENRKNQGKKGVTYTDINRHEVIGMFDEYLYEAKIENCRAPDLLHFLEHRSGILIATGEEHFSFVHRSFQEYLTAKSLSDSPDWKQEIEKYVRDDSRWWREVLLLLIGIKSRHSFGDAMSALFQWIPSEPDEDWQATLLDQWQLILLAASAAVETNLLEERNKHPSYKQLHTNLQQWLKKQMLHQECPIQDRAHAGRLLGLLGDERQGVAIIQGTEPAMPDIDWVRVPAKDKIFMMGADNELDAEKPAHQQNMPEDYSLSRYPITNAQFRVFIDAGGYQNAEYWSKTGWQRKEAEKWETPRFWYRQPWNIDNHPVVGVSWFEAMAFVKWLDSITDEGDVSLPTEREWEFAARGKQNLLYPWGDWEREHANTEELGLKNTSAVGLFPEGKSPFGVEEMAGNVWEWTHSQWGQNWDKSDFAYPYDESDGRENEEENNLFVFRGGSWYFNSRDARSSNRSWYDPGNRYFNIGFRVLLSLASDS